MGWKGREGGQAREGKGLWGGPAWIRLPPRRMGALVFDALAVPLGSANSAPKPPGPRSTSPTPAVTVTVSDVGNGDCGSPPRPPFSLAHGPPGRPRERRNKEEEEDLFRSQPSVSSFPPPPLARQTNKQHVAGKGEGWPRGDAEGTCCGRRREGGPWTARFPGKGKLSCVMWSSSS